MLYKKLLRTAWNYKAQFISMILMVAIGMGVFLGFHAEWYSLKKDTDYFMAQTHYADYRLYDDHGFTKEDITAIQQIAGVDSATRFLSVNVGVKNDLDQSLALTVVEDYVNTKMLISEGHEYDENADGFYLSDKFAAQNGIVIGDILTLTYSGKEIQGAVISLVKSSEYMVCVADSNQLMPDYRSFGFVYITPQKLESTLGMTFYPQINICSSLAKADIEEAIGIALGKTTMLLTKEQHTAYAAAQSEIEEGQTMGIVLPLLFLAIGVLTMITTMHRITVNEKTQIGTLKALGFKNHRILWHYTSYGLFIGLIGSLFAIALGYGIAAIVINPHFMQGTYFDLPKWALYMPYYCWAVLIALIGALIFISFLSVKKMLKGSAADALRPYTPKKVKSLLIEKTKLWGKMHFGTRWNIRDCLRHKSRTTMSLIGVIGCTILLVAGLGMKDTMSGFLDLIDKKIYAYETRVNFTETALESDTMQFIEDYNADYLAQISGDISNKSLTFDIYDVKNERIRFVDKNNKTVSLKDDGVYICLRLAERYAIGETIHFSPFGTNQTYDVQVAGVIRSFMNENITMTAAYAKSIGIPFHVNAAFCSQRIDEIASASFIAGMQTKQSVMDSYDSFMEIMNVMVLIFVLAAVVLGVVVLYNLGVMSYVERYRELATLKVVGFKNKRIGHLLISQNLWLTLIGLLVGIPSGAGVLYVLLKTMASEYELKMIIGILTYAFSTLLIMGVSFVVGLFIAKKNKRINMVEALKGNE